MTTFQSVGRAGNSLPQNHHLLHQVLQTNITSVLDSLNSGYISNKTEIKLKQNNFVSVLFQTWLHVKLNRNKTLKQF